MEKERLKRELAFYDEQALRIALMLVLDGREIEDAMQVAYAYLPEDVRERLREARVRLG
jgi:hypothetical protein